MIINERCSNWSLAYTHSSDVEENEIATKVHSDLLHTVGDIVSILIGFQEKNNPEMLARAVEVVYGGLLKFREDTQTGINFAIAEFGMAQELTGEFSSESIFGTDLVGQLRSVLRNEQEQELANEYLELDTPESDEDGNEIL